MRHNQEKTNQTYFHVTRSADLDAILKNGLRPATGDRSAQCHENTDRVYLFGSRADMETAVMNWLGDQFPESERLTCIELKIPPEIQARLRKSAIEITCDITIPPECIVRTEEI